ncbi:flagellar assembly protein FliW [Paenibacillus aquistagni]|uniref:Flagellar assembly factor FliW n=1 Tax=Paenibacillus aquistagni TaxID=1852522 RepID=A0A1X7KYC7_9BACL|nr:flagellar assembly protein FliW [Paenibacillus aquistagni]SMG46042.1 flagellar assembly factor FliW [Paenibacillus aquistagni]
MIISSIYGELMPEPHQVYHFVKGMVGFQAVRDFALLPYEDTPFYILHGTEGQTSFILLPAEQVQHYSFEIDRSTAELLELTKPEDAVTLLVVNMDEGEISVNLRAPVLLHPASQKGCQYVIHDQSVPLRYVLNKGGDHAART